MIRNQHYRMVVGVACSVLFMCAQAAQGANTVQVSPFPASPSTVASPPPACDSTINALGWDSINQLWTCNPQSGGGGGGGPLVSSQFARLPWVDVKSGANGCSPAVGNGSTNDTAAIQCQLTYMNVAYGGGIVFFPAGSYLVAGGGITVPAGVWLKGSGQSASAITVATDSKVVTFSITGGTCPIGNHYGGMEKMAVYGFTSSPAMAAVTIGAGCNVTITDSTLLYGKYGLLNDGVDSRVTRSFIWGYYAALYSGGANWYVNVKFDQPGPTAATNAYQQGPNAGGLTLAENHFTDCDFSGSYKNSVYIDDATGTSAITTFVGSVFSSEISIQHAKATMFVGAEIGTTIFYVNSGKLNVVGSYAYSPTTIIGAAPRSCAGNSNITC